MRRRLALVLGLLVVSALGGCGGGPAGKAGADPASVVPRSAPFYVEATVRPEGDLRKDLLAAAGKILGTQQPEAELRKLFDRLAEGEDVDYDRDIKPWLGERAGVWGEISSDAQGGSDVNRFAAIIAATDVEKALETIEKGARTDGKKLQSRSHNGTEYLFDPTDATGLAGVEDFVVIATEAELKRTIDTAKGDGLSSSAKYKNTVGDLPDARAGLFYVDAGPLLAKEVSAADLGPLAAFFDPRKIPPVAGALLANGERIALEAKVKVKGSPLLGALGTLTAPSSQLLQELPGDTLAAFGIPDLGKTAKTLFNQFAGAFGGAAVSAQLKQQTGLDLERDVFAWIGDVAVFARGAGPDGLEGGLVIEVVDEAAAAGAFGKFVALARTQASQLKIEPTRIDGAESAFTVTDAEVPKEIVFARSAERVVLAYGKASAEAAFSPAAKLGDSKTWDEVGQTLGGDIDPSLFVDMQWLLANLDAFGAVKDEPDFDQVRPYLERLSVIAIGTSGGGDSPRSTFAVGFK